MRRRRTTVSIELRKANRDDQLLKRRNVAINEPLSPVSDNNANETMSISEIAQGNCGIFKKTFHNSLFVVLSHGADGAKIFEAVQAARKILSREKSPPIDDLVKAGIVPKLVQFLGEEYA